MLDPEKRRIEFLIERDGLEATRAWVARTMKIYRQAVLYKGDINKRGHFATTIAFRRKFIESYLSFKKFLRETQSELV